MGTTSGSESERDESKMEEERNKDFFAVKQTYMWLSRNGEAKNYQKHSKGK